DARGLPIVLKLTEGQAHDGRSARDMLDTLGAGQILLADRAYDSDDLRTDLALSSTDTATASNASSTNANTSAPSPRASKNTTPTTSQSLNSHQSKSGCAIMSRWPSAARLRVQGLVAPRYRVDRLGREDLERGRQDLPLRPARDGGCPDLRAQCRLRAEGPA